MTRLRLWVKNIICLRTPTGLQMMILLLKNGERFVCKPGFHVVLALQGAQVPKESLAELQGDVLHP